MFYIYAIVSPVLVLVVLYYMRKPRLKTFIENVDFLYRGLPFLVVYALILYYLETENLINSGYAFLSIITFLVPLTIILFAIKSYHWCRQRR